MENSNFTLNSLQALNAQIYFLGTSHFAIESANAVQKALSQINPDCVMIELDVERYNELKNRESGKKDSEKKVLPSKTQKVSYSRSKHSRSGPDDAFI